MSASSASSSASSASSATAVPVASSAVPVPRKGTQRPWTEHEDAQLKKAVAQHTEANEEGDDSMIKVRWVLVGAMLNNRNEKQARSRWFNHVDPSVLHTPYTVAEDKRLMELFTAQPKERGLWVAIAKQIPGRSANSVKNRWNNNKRKQDRKKKPKPAKGTIARGRPKVVEDAAGRNQRLGIGSGTKLPTYGLMVISSVAKLSTVAPQCPAKYLAQIAGCADLTHLNRVPFMPSASRAAIGLENVIKDIFSTWPEIAKTAEEELIFSGGKKKRRKVPVRMLIVNECRILLKRGTLDGVDNKYTDRRGREFIALTKVTLAAWPVWLAKLSRTQVLQIRTEAQSTLKRPSGLGPLRLDRSLMSEVCNIFKPGGKSYDTKWCSFRTAMKSTMMAVGYGESTLRYRGDGSTWVPRASASASASASSKSAKRPRAPMAIASNGLSAPTAKRAAPVRGRDAQVRV